MKKLNLATMLLGAALFTGLGAVSLSASGTKCGADKCGSSMGKSVKKCGAQMKAVKKCGAQMKAVKKCGAGKCGIGKCGAGKCDAAKYDPAKYKKKATMKCGAGKCGSK